jgi:FtsH-binding integral membrane protein
VYLTLAATIFSAAVGSVIHILYDIGGLLTFFCSIALLVWLALERDQSKRFYILLGFALSQGATIGPLLSLTLTLDDGHLLIAKAFSAAVLIFVCFSGSVLLSPRRSYLYLYGSLSSALALLWYMAFFNLFFASPLVASVSLYLGLFTFVGFVIFDTQLMLEKADCGDHDYVSHALELFIDFLQLFVRLLILLIKNSKKRKE